MNFAEARPTAVAFFAVDERVVDKFLESLDDLESLPRTCVALDTCMDRLGGLAQLWSSWLTLVPVLCPAPDEAALEAASLIVESEGITAARPCGFTRAGRAARSGGTDTVLHGDDFVAADRCLWHVALTMRSLVAIGPLPVEPRARRARVLVAKHLPVVLASDARMQTFGDDIGHRLIHDLVFDPQQCVRPQDARRLRREQLARLGRLEDASIKSILWVFQQRPISGRVGRVQLPEVRLVRTVRVRTNPLPCALKVLQPCGWTLGTAWRQRVLKK